MNPSVFHMQGIRGTYPDGLDAAFLHELGVRLAAHFGGTFVVGHAGVVSSAQALTPAGAVAGGARVVDVGEVSQPQFSWAIRSLQGNAGLLCSAHGVQVFTRQGDSVELLHGGHIRQVFDSHTGVTGIGTYEQRDIAADYAASVAYAAGWRGGQELRLAIDAPLAVHRVLKHFGPIAPDPALAARFDAEGDMTLYLHGVRVPSHHMFLMLAESGPAGSVCVDACSSRVVRERLNESGVEHHMRQEACHSVIPPELTLLRVLQACGGDAGQLEQMLAPYSTYLKDEVVIPVRDQKHAGHIQAVLAAKFSEHTAVHHADCLTIDAWDADDFWLHTHLSRTNPTLCVTIEAKEKDLLDEKVGVIRALAG